MNISGTTITNSAITIDITYLADPVVPVWYNLSEFNAGGMTIVDASGNRNNAKIHSILDHEGLLVDTLTGGGMKFSGTQWVASPYVLSQDFTVSMAIKYNPDLNNFPACLWGSDYWDNNSGYLAAFTDTDIISFGIAGDQNGFPGPNNVEFIFQNDGYNYSVDEFDDTTYPTLTVVRGETYSFNFTNVGSGHPIALRLTSGNTSAVPGTTGNNPSSGVYGDGTVPTTVTYQVPLDAPSVIYYQCVVHSGMIGTINVVNPSTVQAQLTSPRVVTVLDFVKLGTVFTIYVNGQVAGQQDFGQEGNISTLPIAFGGRNPNDGTYGITNAIVSSVYDIKVRNYGVTTPECNLIFQGIKSRYGL